MRWLREALLCAGLLGSACVRELLRRMRTASTSPASRVGRWAQRRTLEIYIQEVGVASLLSTLSVLKRERVRHVALGLNYLIEKHTLELRGSTQGLGDASSLKA